MRTNYPFQALNNYANQYPPSNQGVNLRLYSGITQGMETQITPTIMAKTTRCNSQIIHKQTIGKMEENNLRFLSKQQQAWTVL